MSIEDELYQEIIIEHYRARENRRVLESATHSERGDNPACGDALTLFIRDDGRRIQEIAYDGVGCAICCASANMLCRFLPDDWGQALALYERMRTMLTGGEQPHFDGAREDLEALAGVRKFPLRVKCALLPWSALYAIVAKRSAE